MSNELATTTQSSQLPTITDWTKLPALIREVEQNVYSVPKLLRLSQETDDLEQARWAITRAKEQYAVNMANVEQIFDAPPASLRDVIGFCRKLLIGYPSSPHGEELHEAACDMAVLIVEEEASLPLLCNAWRRLKTEAGRRFFPTTNEVIEAIRAEQQKMEFFRIGVECSGNIDYYEQELERRIEEEAQQ